MKKVAIKFELSFHCCVYAIPMYRWYVQVLHVSMQAWSGCSSASGPDEACVPEAAGEEGKEEGRGKEQKKPPRL